MNFALHSFLIGTQSAQDIIGSGAKEACPNGSCGVVSVNSLFSSVTSLLLFVIGAISIIMIIIGGLRYVLSSGDAKNTAAARETILYAVVGLVIAASAYAIISFVTTHLK